MMARRRVAVLISGNGSNLQALLDAAAAPEYPAEIALVISNKAEAYGLTRAEKANVATRVIDHRAHANRADYDNALDAALREAEIELVCLAGFMRLLTPAFVAAWEGRMLNIHPSLLPAYRGLDTHRRVLADGARFSGCSVHFVVPEVDAGPIVVQAAVPVLAEDDEASLAARIHAAEHRIYPQALRWLAAGDVTIEGQCVKVRGAEASEMALINPSLASHAF